MWSGFARRMTEGCMPASSSDSEADLPRSCVYSVKLRARALLLNMRRARHTGLMDAYTHTSILI